MSPAAPEGKKPSTRHVVYFSIAAFLLLIVALTWSVDPSLDYILLGAAAFFLFLGFWTRPRLPVQRSSFQKHAGRGARPSHDLFTVLKDLLSGKANPRTSRQKNPSAASGKNVVMAASFFIFTVFFIIIVVVIWVESETVSNDADIYYQHAEQFRWSGEYDSADHYYRQALLTRPDYPEALTGYGHDWLARQNYDSALYLFNKALIIDPDFSDAAYGKALAYNYQQNYRQSLRETFALMERAPEYAEATLLAGDNYYMQQRYDSAIYWYENGYGKGQRSAALCHVMAYIYDTQGKQERAVPLYQEALSYDSTLLAVYTRLGELFPGQDGNLYRTKAKELKVQGYGNP